MGGSPCQLISRLISGIRLTRRNQSNTEDNILNVPPNRMDHITINVQSTDHQNKFNYSSQSEIPTTSHSNFMPVMETKL